MSPIIKPQSRSAWQGGSRAVSAQTAPQEMTPVTSHSASSLGISARSSPQQKARPEQSPAGTCEQPLTQPGCHCCATPENRKGTAGKELCRRSLHRYKSTGTPKDTNKSTKPKAAPTAVNLPNGRDSSRKTIFPSARQLLCYSNYPREFTDGFLSGSLFISHIFCLFPKTDLITPTCTRPALTHWWESKCPC